MQGDRRRHGCLALLRERETLRIHRGFERGVHVAALATTPESKQLTKRETDLLVPR
jgi:hypothetical protein